MSEEWGCTGGNCDSCQSCNSSCNSSGANACNVKQTSCGRKGCQTYCQFLESSIPLWNDVNLIKDSGSISQFNSSKWNEIIDYINAGGRIGSLVNDGNSTSSTGYISPFTAEEFKKIAASVHYFNSGVEKNLIIKGEYFSDLKNAAKNYIVNDKACDECDNSCNSKCNSCQSCNTQTSTRVCCGCNTPCEACQANCQNCDVCLGSCDSNCDARQYTCGTQNEL